MNNILYIGPYRDSNGYGYSSRRYIDCLSSNTKINLSIRPLFYSRSYDKNQLNVEKYSEYENNSCKNYDVLIQHCYPDFYEYDVGFGKNIGIVQIETFGINRSGWIDRLNMMDEIWVGSIFAKTSLMDAGVKKNIKIIPEPYDISQYEANLDPFFSIKTEKKPFIFYTIGQYNNKKNIKNIILAFMLEFEKQENVRLFIKTGDHNIHHKELENIITYDIHQLKIASRKYNNCPDIDIITGIIKDIDVIRLHKDADCYINAVRSDDNGACAIEAKLSDSIIINTKNIGSNTYFNSSNSFLVDSTKTRVLSTDQLNYAVFTPNEYWLEPDINSLRKTMREAFFISKEHKEYMNINFNKEIFNKNKICELLL